MLDRYATPEMQALWGNEKTKFEYWLKVELAVLEARVTLGMLSREAFEAIRTHAAVDVARIHALDKEYRHDLIAFVVCVQESLQKAGVGQYKEEFHKDLTSYDVEDPAFILMLREANELILAELRKLLETLRHKAHEHKRTLMIGRTHGQYAEPTTFGHLLLVFADCAFRNDARLDAMQHVELDEGKISGPIGNYAGMDPRIGEAALRILGLEPARAETQILQRDRHAMFFCTLAVTAASIEQMCRTFWR
jgi:adenylosuccinate lyase